MTGTAVALIKPRLPMPGNVMDAGEWAVLTNAIFPNARSPESILLAREYCRVRNLDIMKRPVNIVPMWDSRANNGDGGYVEQIWPAITETQVTAARSGEWAGMDKPEWGPDVTHTFKGRKRISGKWENAEVTVTFPEWCAVTVYRLVDGKPYAFCEPVYWREAYARIGGSELPNDMWCKRPRGQFHKVAKAASLRAAFPEEGGYDETEIEGATVHVEPEPPKPRDNWQPPNQPGARRDPKPDGDNAQERTGSDEHRAPTTQATPPQGSQPAPAQTGQSAQADQYSGHDAGTGEIKPPHDIGKGGEESWITWGQRLIACVQTSRNEDEIKAWGEANASHIEAMKKPEAEGGAPKVEIRLQTAITKHRNNLVAPGGPTIIGAG